MFKSIKIYTRTRCQVSICRATGPLVLFLWITNKLPTSSLDTSHEYFMTWLRHFILNLTGPYFTIDISVLLQRCWGWTLACPTKCAATWQNQQSECAPCEDSDQPGHPSSLIRVFAVHMKKPWALSYPLIAQQRLIRLGGCPGWSESSLGAHSLCWFCHVVAQINVLTNASSEVWTNLFMLDIWFGCKTRELYIFNSPHMASFFTED